MKVCKSKKINSLLRYGKENANVGRINVIRATTDSPMSPPMSASISLNKQSYKGKSLLDIWMERSVPKNPKPEFQGRLNSDGPIAKLYRNLKDGGVGPREAMLEG